MLSCTCFKFDCLLDITTTNLCPISIAAASHSRDTSTVSIYSFYSLFIHHERGRRERGRERRERREKGERESGERGGRERREIES
jgi:hypothetical protein